MKVLSIVVFLVALQAIISVSINAVNSVQSVGTSLSSVLPAEDTASQFIAEGEQLFTSGGNTSGVFTQGTLKRF